MKHLPIGIGLRRVLLLVSLLVSVPSSAAEPAAPCELTVDGTGFRLDGKPFPYTGVTYPLCLPSRASMLTGRRICYSGPGKQHEFGTLIQLQQTWPASFRKAGCWTATSGKLYHGGVPKVDTAAWDVPGEMWRNGFKDWSPELMKRVVAEAGPKHVVEDFRKNGGGAGSLLSMAVDGDDDALTDGQTASIVTGYPTLLALTGVSGDGLHLDGRSLVPLLENPDAAWPHPAFIHAGKDHGMVTDQYRYSISNNGTEKLFDLRADPDEWRNLAAVPEHADRVKTMRAAVAAAWLGDVVTGASTGTAPKQKLKKTKNTAAEPEE